MAELKPCPFCGNTDIYLDGSDNLPPDDHPYWYVICSECGASVFGNVDPEVAAEAWNRRANDG